MSASPHGSTTSQVRTPGEHDQHTAAADMPKVTAPANRNDFLDRPSLGVTVPEVRVHLAQAAGPANATRCGAWSWLSAGPRAARRPAT